MIYDNFYDLCEILLDRNSYDFTPLYLSEFGEDSKYRIYVNFYLLFIHFLFDDYY